MDFPEERGVKDSKWGGGEGWKLYRRRLLGERGPCSRQGLGKNADCVLGLCFSTLPPLLLTPPTDLLPFHPGSSFSLLGVLGGWAIAFFCETKRDARLVAAIRQSDQPSQRWLQLRKTASSLYTKFKLFIFLRAHRYLQEMSLLG